MYLTPKLLEWAIKSLGNNCHPFLGITFLVCKKEELPVGEQVDLKLDSRTKYHLLNHHSLDLNSAYYFQPFKSNKFWIAASYPSSGLQTINAQTFGSAFIHSKNTTRWGFSSDYVSIIRNTIDTSPGHDLPSLAALAVWIGKYSCWEPGENLDAVIDRFIKEFNLSDKEIGLLFNIESMPPSDIPITSRKKLDVKSVAYSFEKPADAPSQTEGTLASIRFRNIGPGKDLSLEFGERLTLIVGDNGLGKSFLLDGAWWSLTRTWAGRPAYPFMSDSKDIPRIDFKIVDSTQRVINGSSVFSRATQSWKPRTRQHQPSISALSIYARVDGSFAIADEVRGKLQFHDPDFLNLFSVKEVWDGKPGQIEGLIRDWVSWQLTNARGQFNILTRILEHLSPEDIGPIEPGNPIRLPGDPRHIPTIKHVYGDVPVVFASAGVQRILLLAYLIIWAWEEHILASEQANVKPVNKMVIVVDEIEAHLHPKWQRLVLPALMTVGSQLSESLDVQIIASTHSPMILASIESEFSNESDQLAHLFLRDGSIFLENREFYKHGDMSSWLISPLFGLSHARSRQAEQVINDAKELQLSDDISADKVELITYKLKKVLSPDDTFWSRWLYFARKHGDNI